MGGPFRCTEIIGLTITAEWYGAGFEQLVDDARFQARTRPHTFVDQWADPSHEAWSAPITSACTAKSNAPDRVVLFAANWKLTSEEEWARVLNAFVDTAKQRYPQLRSLELYTVLRGPKNQTCGDPKSVVEPMIDAAIARVASTAPGLVHAGPRLEATDCAVFEKGGPHFTEAGRKVVAQQLATALR
ncbi:MAG: SGNH/GDSL hydrolase family protein [Myxococcales bacterium]|nr:MAG: SGNH/GDSL hydrolase family protein [Myxococcales bacterium]